MSIGVRLRRHSVCLVTLGLGALFLASASQAASIQAIGYLPGGDHSSAFGISDDGSVVVGEANSSSGNYAFRWTATTGIQALSRQFSTSTSGMAWDVSGNGAIVVGMDSPGSGTAFNATRWDSLYVPQDLSAGTQAQARGANGNGTVIVGGSNEGAFRWTSATGVQRLGSLSPGLFSNANAVDNSGNVAVGVAYDSSGNGNAARFSGGTVTSLGDLPGGNFDSVAFAVSGDGQYIAGRGTTATGRQPFLWSATMGMIGLGNLGAANTDAEARGVSNGGVRVVGYDPGSPGGFQTAFLWDAAHGMRPLRDVLANDYGMDMTGWILGTAYAISPDGSKIAGYGSKVGTGLNLAWVAEIPAQVPEPASAALSLLGLASLLQRRVRH